MKRIVSERTGREKHELSERIELKRRPRIGIGIGQLDAVSARLSASGIERERFLDDPRSYLQEQRISIPAGCFATLREKDLKREAGGAYVVSVVYTEAWIASLVAGVSDKRQSPTDSSLLALRGLL